MIQPKPRPRKRPSPAPLRLTGTDGRQLAAALGLRLDITFS